MLNDILEQKNAFLGYKYKKLKKSKNCHFSKGVNPWFWSKSGHFSNLWFQAIQARKISLTIFQNEKTPFQAINTRSSKSRKIDIFFKGVNRWFRSKNGDFSNFSFQAIQASNISLTIFQNETTPFQAIKRRSSNSRKIDIFLMGLTHGFGPKMAIFLNFFFRQYRPGKCP